MRRLTYIGTLLTLMAPLAIMAQNNPLGDRDTIMLTNDRILEVIESEKPFIKPPYQEIKKGKIEEFNFQSQDFPVETDFEPAPPKVTPWKPAKKLPYNDNFVKLGIGRYITPLAQLYINNGISKDLDYGVYFSHLSAYQDQVELRKFNNNQLTVQGSKIDKAYRATAAVDFYNSSYFNYAGDDTSRFEGSRETIEDSLKMRYTRFGINGSIASNSDQDEQYFYDAGVGIQFYGDRRKNRETYFELTPKGGLNVAEGFTLNLDTKLAFTAGRIDTTRQNQNLVELMPTVRFQNDQLRVMGGVKFNYANNSIDSTGVTNLAPVIDVRYSLTPGGFTVFAGYEGGVALNTYADMIGQNPYLGTQAYLQPSVEKLNVYAGIEGNVGGSLDFLAKAYHRRVSNQLIFQTYDSLYFQPVYDSLTKISGVYGELNYDMGEGIRAGAALNLNVFSTANQDSLTARYYGAAPVRVDLFAEYNWEDKLHAKLTTFLYGATPVAQDAAGEIVSRSSFMDVSIEADYQITKQISVFVQANNLLNAEFERWQYYPERRLDFMAGLTFGF
ncbi:TonB-dependent receptor [Pontibacter sp. G13]|uniref:TonB-dependent receptor n=1 Tax=Pontibacter sp. G13 TaxID=3074898 RepID=UPI002889C890|nr:TonB-dependent receptor [Pontibacter sp. G13]WNJ18060.1 TonB-dependent receptor [Pontibacter sp. G13]